ncbi:MAG: 2-amino-4-hydroxy-6-hydroxymethyldihydropteridine diphosphokinase, partial [Rubricoccaceae bacterium]|nr:2-amino-4-hydroxy-6-hydroxymethyldihydropteridine diphosphokinase [Rubricoccaceae bacterium]
DRLGGLDGVEVVAVSQVYETEAHVLPGTPPQPDHLNAVVHLKAEIGIERLFGVLRRIENEAGRDPKAPKWSARVLDMDILLFGDLSAEIALEDGSRLEIPHPGMKERRFVLQPLSDLVHNLVVPGADGATVSDLLERCTDSTRVERYGQRLQP